MDPKLVCDVGMHRGGDTAYYLHKGFRVVGVEANPAMADQLRDRVKPDDRAVALWRVINSSGLATLQVAG